MDISQLKYFKTVAETGSFTRAAEALLMTQSALSKSIAKLEEELGLRLFERDGNRITLNRFGQRFLADTTALISGIADCSRAVQEMAGMERGDVVVGISKDIYIDHLIRQFLIDFPDASFHCYLLSPEQMHDGLQNGSVDFVLTTLPAIGPGICWQDLYLDQLEVMLSPRHPLGGKEVLHLDELKNERFVVTNSNYGMNNIIQDLCVRAGFEPKVLYEGTSTDMPMYFLDKQGAVMITPRSITAGVQRLADAEGRTDIPGADAVRSIPLANEYEGMRKMVRLGFKEGHYQSLAAQRFCDRVLTFYSGLEAP